MHFRLSDLVLFVTFWGVACGLGSSLARGQAEGSLIVCVIGIATLPLLLFLRPRIGTIRCPYCDAWAVRPNNEVHPTICDACGSRFEREGRGPLVICSTPSDDRVWVGKFMPKLRSIRRELRPAEHVETQSNAGDEWFVAK
jgi:hypothetical protein